MLLDHTGKVLDTDSMNVAFEKVEMGIKGQTNQAVARHKLMRSINQGQKAFASWFPIVKEHAKHCDFTGYDTDAATRDSILFQTLNVKLQQKILAEDLNLADTIKYGLALEQTKTAAEALSVSGRTEEGRLAKVEDQICALSTGKSGSSSNSSTNPGKKCDRCNFSHVAGVSGQR